MKLSRMTGLVILLLVAALVPLSGCDTQAKRAMELVDQKLKAAGVKKTEMTLFVVDPGAADRAYLSLVATWGFADKAGEPQKEYLGFFLKKDGDGWQIEKLGVRYAEDKNRAIELLHGGK